MKLDDFKKYLTDYFIKENGITNTTPFTIEEIDARKLIVPERIDLVAKWLYIDFRERKLQSPFAADLYKEHLAAFSMGTFNEPGSPEKDSLDKYLDTFDALIDEIKENGFDDTKSLVPVGNDNIILDGAHRVAACAYFGKPIKIIRFPDINRNFDCNFFTSRGLNQKHLDALTVEYCKLKSNTYGICIWQKAYAVDKARGAEDIIRQSSVKIVSRKQVSLSYRGTKNLLLQIYSHHYWTGDYTNGFKGTERKVDEVYANNDKLTVFIVETNNFDTILDIKNKIRDIYKIENSSIHITDNQEETIQLANLIFNKNSLHYLNHAKIEKYKSTHKRLEHFKDAVAKNGGNLEDHIVDAGSILSLYGIREASDFDYLSVSSVLADGQESLGLDAHDSQLRYYYYSKDDMIFNPEHHFVFNDTKFVSLDRVIEMKKSRDEQKDRDDLSLINSLIKRSEDPSCNNNLRNIQIKIRRGYGRNKTRLVARLDAIGMKAPLVKIRDRLRRKV